VKVFKMGDDERGGVGEMRRRGVKRKRVTLPHLERFPTACSDL
jgi:hypothetical protein